MGSDALRLGPQAAGIMNEGTEEPVGLEEICGAIKWFDASKGYGFIVPDDGGPDVLVHVTCLRRDGFHTAIEGARVVCEAVRRAKGRQAFRVLSLDLSTAVHPAPQPARVRVEIEAREGFERAVVKWFNRLRGFGFLTQGDDTPDIFVHMETLRLHGLTELRPGQSVLVRYGDGPKGLMAAEVKADTGTSGNH
ncbi:cold-shock protein [Xanthobacter sediminis]|uniref:cold-shock protein n=1 Tax=Xanthobacter sediminis TaxID=3119926 RepID=UPI00372CF226